MSIERNVSLDGTDPRVLDFAKAVNDNPDKIPEHIVNRYVTYLEWGQKCSRTEKEMMDLDIEWKQLIVPIDSVRMQKEKEAMCEKYLNTSPFFRDCQYDEEKSLLKCKPRNRSRYEQFSNWMYGRR